MKTFYTIKNLGKAALAFSLLSIPNLINAQGSFEDHSHEAKVLYEVFDNGRSKIVDNLGQEFEFRAFGSYGVDQIISMGSGASVKYSNGAKSSTGPTFKLVYMDRLGATGQGFDDPNLGAKRRQVLQAAFDYVSSMIGNTGNIDIEISPSVSQNIQRFAVSSVIYPGQTGFTQSYLMKHLFTGIDPNTSKPDGTIEFNFHPNYAFFYDYPGEPAGSQYDFYTICLHEICHLLGITSNLSANGNSAITSSVGVFSTYDQFLRKQDGTPLIIGTSVNPVSLLSSNNITFELGNGNFAPVYSPSTFGGSSLSHVDNTRSSGTAFLMNPSLGRGQTVRFLNRDEALILQQLGYTIDMGVATSVNEEFSSQFNETPVVGELYPNPSSKDKAVKINISNVKEREILVVVYDILGRQAYSKVLMNDGGEGGTHTAIDPSHNLAAGMYIVVGSTKDELFNKKLIIR
jgi:hypothetical protein